MGGVAMPVPEPDAVRREPEHIARARCTTAAGLPRRPFAPSRSKSLLPTFLQVSRQTPKGSGRIYRLPVGFTLATRRRPHQILRAHDPLPRQEIYADHVPHRSLRTPEHLRPVVSET